jgi:hypothetical protein
LVKPDRSIPPGTAGNRKGKIMTSVQSGKPRRPVSRNSVTSKTPSKPAPAVAATPKKTLTATKKAKAAPAPKLPATGSEAWREMVATAAYHRAEARGFIGGSSEQDWFEAEAEIMASLVGKPA